MGRFTFFYTNRFSELKYRKSFSNILCLSIIGWSLLVNNSFAAKIIYEKAYSPYYLNETLTIDNADTLIILEGTTIIIDTAVDIVVNGTMLIQGTADEPVQILPKVDTIGWGRIYLNKTGSDCKFEHALIVDGAVLSIEANLTYRDVHFKNRQKLPLYYNITRIERATVDLQNCSIEGTGTGEGFLLINMKNAIIRNCTFFNIPDAVECIKVRDSKISNNFFTDLPDDAVDCNKCDNVVIDSNIIVRAQDRGIEIGAEIFGSSTNIIIRQNLIIGCRVGIIFKEGSSGLITNNTLYQNKIGLVCMEIGPWPGGSHINVENTIISQSVEGDIKTDSLSELIISFSLSDTEPLEGIANLFTDPLFTDPENNDFTLLESSRCIDSGNPASPPDPDGSTSDMGAYFFNQDTLSSIAPVKSPLQSIRIYPNPFASVLHVSFNLPGATKFAVELYSLDGRKARSVSGKTRTGGQQTISINFREGKPIQTGFYVCVVSFDDLVKGFRVMHIR